MASPLPTSFGGLYLFPSLENLPSVDEEIQVIIKHIKKCSTSLVVPFLIHHVGKNGSLKVL